MFCRNCGYALTEDAKFCPECGSRCEEEVVFTPESMQTVPAVKLVREYLIQIRCTEKNESLPENIQMVS